MSNRKVTLLKKELQTIREANDGFLTPEIVLKYAENPSTILHKEFEWSNDKAAEKYRLLQAGTLIRSISVTIVDEKRDDKIIQVREYVSLKTDRGKNGYRHIADVLYEDDLRVQFISDIQGDLNAVRGKLKTISDVADKHLEKVMSILESEKAMLKKRKQA